MARSSNRVGLFTSHRGRVAKKFLIIGATCLIVLFFGNGILADPSDESDSTDYEVSSYDEGTKKTSTIAAPIARPFALPLPGSAEEVDGGDIYGNDVDDDSPLDEDPNSVTGFEDDSQETDGGSEDETATDKLQKADSYQSAVTLTQDFVAAYTTYSPDETPQDWVDSLPSLEKTAKAKLLKSAEERWPGMRDRRLSSKGAVDSQSVTPIYSRDGGGTIQLSVTANKEISYEGDSWYQTDSYAVTLKRAPDSSEKWIIVAVE